MKNDDERIMSIIIIIIIIIINNNNKQSSSQFTNFRKCFSQRKVKSAFAFYWTMNSQLVMLL